MPTPVIVLHGASSSGKSTLARAVQATAAKPFWYLSIDHFRDCGAWPIARYRYGEFDWGRDRARLFAGFHAMIGAAANTGNSLIVEHILDTQGWLDTLRFELKTHDALFVAVHCPLPVIAARETARADRPVGSAAKDLSHIHKGLHYDLELDGQEDPTANARAILTALAGDVRRSSLCNP